ncbi:hypothetical protein GTA51_10085 [Desulfovibrio aerotolerans]|uniref:NolW-like domain-containing protein n=1 Tax=Solidesulfovibrio aerotolerans TaxID=295255 RepID=A0A7C9ML47_9BACT|nr:hypothetical protein [Solidesulfovibrio aerotolerans]
MYCSVVPDTHSNTLIVQGPPSDLKKVIKIIDSIDKPPYQIKLKAFIVETSQATAQQLGVQWGGQLKNSNFQITPAQSATSSSTTTVGNVGSNTATTNGATNSSLNTNGSLSSNTTGSTVLGRTQNVTDATRTPPGDANFPGVDNYNSTKNTTNNTLSSNSATAAETLAASVASALLGATGASSNASTGTATSTNTSIPFFQGGSSGSGFGLNYPTLTSAATAGTGLNFLFGKIGGTILEAQLTALAGESKVTILSSPTITTMENQIASIENGKEIPYSTTSQQGTNTQYKNATLKLEITPHVVDGTSLRMKILVKDDQVDENQSNWVQGTPPLFKRETKSNLVVEDGDTIVISGLTRDKNSDTENGVPFLSNIPGLGWAFKSKGKAYEKSDVLIFITPTILGEKPIASIPPSTAKGLGTSSPNQSSGQ